MERKNLIVGQEIFDALQLVSSFIPTPIYWENIDSIILGANRHVLTAVGLQTLDDYVGKSLYDLYPKAMADRIKVHNEQVMTTGQVLSQEESIIDISTGEVKYYTAIKAPLYNSQNELIGLIGTSVNITELKHTQKKLEQAKDAAEAANRAKTEFLANMSHDMKMPLSGIVSSADVIAYDKSTSDKNRQVASIISASGRQLSNFFTSCLDLSKLGMKDWMSSISIFSIKKIMDDIYFLYLPKALSKQLVLQVNTSEDLSILVEGHRDSLYRVLLNLVGNAIKFTEKGSVTLCANMIEQLDEENISVQFEVRDTGIGIPENKYKVIFEKLHRLKPSYESNIEGSGIGLYIVDQYIKRMKGKITVMSTVGAGSIFTVTLPLKISNSVSKISFTESSLNQDDKKLYQMHDYAEPKIGTIKSIKSDKADKSDKNSICLSRILVVEDADLIQVVTKMLLNEIGFNVDVASSGEEALAMFEPGKYGIIFMDIGLPAMNGYEASKAIRAKEAKAKADQRVPIIALTGHGAVDVQRFCGEAGMQAILSKPLSHDQAKKIWQFYGEQQSISIPGLTMLEQNHPIIPEHDILDIKATITRIGSQKIAKKMIDDFIDHLQEKFLPSIKAVFDKKDRQELRFLLHQQIGSVLYIEAPLLHQTLLSVQKAAKSDQELTIALYQEIESAVLQLLDFYHKSHEKKKAP